MYSPVEVNIWRTDFTVEGRKEGRREGGREGERERERERKRGRKTEEVEGGKEWGRGRDKGGWGGEGRQRMVMTSRVTSHSTYVPISLSSWRSRVINLSNISEHLKLAGMISLRTLISWMPFFALRNASSSASFETPKVGSYSSLQT